ncbi:type II toxin-antitoxin system RelE/ParE family toxin [Rhizobium lentis]|uniref:Type II toxin-antitoxin system RelE/ParE family toxin n=1 Tax=Rhizobium lentis TaxID=1138194 RepID=A0ABS7I8V3_9HYPH|nr:type II toxin-antitoxin system RelE/ParE family toxin [Rhizobium lentis]MBX4958693.1 type II toxin-antitoxin system RelE/ParE family toxin [Rhizobium lentis]MBX4976927.1 type II toxin-antitoxin system RelE/ParE family toxin [Rhizobium lentis]MBX4988753.1 type II toxin-antitoxin system RelE/ParE family toxin [Rhizobium lentis]MBX5007202.1 type II toxin-antitoxin system RelE/ParE family toxin [Rhizobium lentis]MBX5031798.1 type II toxin-antitoxin system RelE/ParE family toxin [Rhizobium lenti
MKRYRIRLTNEAELDLAHIYRFVRKNSASSITAREYVARIKRFVDGFETYPERGSIRDDVRPGLRIVGFERRVSVAFVVEPTEVVILRILYAGQRLESDES